MTGELLSVNVAKVRLIMLNGQPAKTGIFKFPVEGRVATGPEGLVGDRQIDRKFHGGIDKAIYAYAREDYEWWEAELERECEPGLFGENLTTTGVDPSHATIGERWRIGTTLLEVSEPRAPCSKLAARMEDRLFVKRFAKVLRLGAYMRVIEPGELGAGDPIEVVERPDHGITTETIGRIVFGDRTLIAQALEAPALSSDWRKWMTERAAKAG